MDWCLNSDSKNLLNSLQKKFHNCSISFLKIDESKYVWYPTLNWRLETYYRLEIPNLLPDINKIIYLDVDIIINKDIWSFYDYDICKYAIWAPSENINTIYNYLLGIPKEYKHFNAWMLLMNLQFFRENNIFEKVFNYLNTTENIYLWDQDALNKILYDKRLELPWFTNVTPSIAYMHYLNLEKSIVIHYAWVKKPRKMYCIHPLKTLYIKYRKLSWLSDIVLSEKFCLRKYLSSKLTQLYYILRWKFPLVTYYLWVLRLKIIHIVSKVSLK